MTNQISRDSNVEFTALAAAIHPAWHQAIIRLANSTERVAFRLETFMGTPIDGGMARHARELIKDLIDFLDQLDADSDLEPTAGASCTDECEPPEDAEPSLGSFDCLMNQDTSWRTVHGEFIAGPEAEQDDCDIEPSLGSLDHNHSQERWAVGGRRDLENDGAESGIGDYDGLLEQVGPQDWQQGGMA
ncbi:hypothetical protein IVB03_02980 [Bradyrhizobium sp. 168]|uniref:hypothetical protein n=1 Tax=Bradyrhizobium sp. 168 TaxID=2782639 RepID=UPI001FF8AF2F|nr:hypothetical protein [Bradyrhizobium sp. 168]MCK1578572.1 hypothetical protein [Bradyrhizobium sp. 168]